MAASQGDAESLIIYFRSLKPERRPAMRGTPSDWPAPTRRHLFTAEQIMDPGSSQLFIDIEGDVLTGVQDFLQSSVQQECFRADSALGAVAPERGLEELCAAQVLWRLCACCRRSC